MPFASCTTIDTADNAARRVGTDTAEQHELVLRRHAQCGRALEENRAFRRLYMAAGFDVRDTRFRKTVATLEGDVGIYPTAAQKLGAFIERGIEDGEIEEVRDGEARPPDFET